MLKAAHLPGSWDARPSEGQGSISPKHTEPAPTHVGFPAAICPSGPPPGALPSPAAVPLQTVLPSTLTTRRVPSVKPAAGRGPVPHRPWPICAQLWSLKCSVPTSWDVLPQIPPHPGVLFPPESPAFAWPCLHASAHPSFTSSSSGTSTMRLLPTPLGECSLPGEPPPYTQGTTEGPHSSVGLRVGPQVICADAMGLTGWGASGHGGRWPLQVAPFTRPLLCVRHCGQASVLTHAIGSSL